MDKRSAILPILLLFISLDGAFPQSGSQIELVESFPAETTLDDPGIRNTAEVWKEMIRGSSRTLDIEQFYLSNQSGEALEEIISEIIIAAGRGVAVRLIADARMYKTYPETIDSLKKQKNIQARIIDFGKISGGIQHAKYFISDGEEIFLGSQNFDWRAIKHIHELGLRLRSRELAAIYGDIFEIDWQLSAPEADLSKRAVPVRKSYPWPLGVNLPGGEHVSLTPTMSPKGAIPDTALWDETQLVRNIDQSDKEILCQFLTYSPAGRDKKYYEAFEDGFRRAASRGVKVKMIVSDWSLDPPAIDYLKNLSAIKNIEVKFSSIPEWSGGYVPYGRVDHSKYFVFDSGRAWIGTSNCEKSYFYTSRNLGLIVGSDQIAGKLRNFFFRSWDSPYTKPIRQGESYQAREHGEK